MYTFVLVMFLGIHPELKKPVFVFVDRYPLASLCQQAANNIKNNLEKQEDKDRVGCLPLFNPNNVHEI